MVNSKWVDITCSRCTGAILAGDDFIYRDGYRDKPECFDCICHLLKEAEVKLEKVRDVAHDDRNSDALVGIAARSIFAAEAETGYDQMMSAIRCDVENE